MQTAVVVEYSLNLVIHKIRLWQRMRYVAFNITRKYFDLL